MVRKGLTALLVLVFWVWAGQVQATDPTNLPAGMDAPLVTLGGYDRDASTTTLGYDGDADTELVLLRRFHLGFRRGFGYSYYRPYFNVGFSYGYYPRYYSYYRPFYSYGYSSYYRPFYSSFSYYRPYYSSFSYYRPYYYSYYSPIYNYGYSSYCPSYYYSQPIYYSSGYCFINGTNQDIVPAQPLVPAPQTPTPQGQVTPPENVPVMPKVPESGEPGKSSYDYDGGPANPIPMPVPGNGQPAPVTNPKAPTLKVEGKLVLVTGPPQDSGFTFLAYGEQPVNTPAPETAAVTRTSNPLSGFAFPAYGEAQEKVTYFATSR